MNDQLLEIDGGVIHHGKLSNRIYVLKVPYWDNKPFIKKLEALAYQNQYGKIIVKIPEYMKEEYKNFGYHEEAYIPHYYLGMDSCSFVCKYMDPSRKEILNGTEIDNVIKKATNVEEASIDLPSNITCRVCNEQESEEMVRLYKTVFDTYPFPIFEKDYIEETMLDHIRYFGLWKDSTLIGLSSAEMDVKGKNAEMTDFAILPEYRGQNLSSILLNEMEKEMNRIGIPLVYTIARAVSYGMNCTFGKSGYTFTGTLYNNTQIAGGIESMNVWYKEF